MAPGPCPGGSRHSITRFALADLASSMNPKSSLGIVTANDQYWRQYFAEALFILADQNSVVKVFDLNHSVMIRLALSHFDSESRSICRSSQAH